MSHDNKEQRRSVQPHKAGERLNGKVRLRDIATATGFSINTVSHALKDKPDISAATKALIRDKASEMGYIADALAGSLRSGRSRTIAVILGDMANPHFGIWVREIETKAFSRGYSTLIMNTNEDEQMERDAIRTAIGKRVDGLIICPTQKTRQNLDLLKEAGLPYVLIGRRFGDDDSPYVIPDDIKSGEIATCHLLDQGCRRILMLNGPPWISSARERQQGYCRAHEAYDLACRTKYIRSCGVTSGSVRAILAQVAAENLNFDAILSFSDLIALEALAILRQQAPDRTGLPLVGFDDILSSLHMPVALTSVAPRASIADQVLTILLRLIEPEGSQPKPGQENQVVIDVRLVMHP